MKGKWWYYISIRAESFGSSVTGFPAENPSMANPPFYHTNLQNITEKNTWKLRKNHRITEFIGWNNKQMPYRSAGSTYWGDATYAQDTASWASNVRYEGTITPKFFVSAMVAESGYQWQNKNHTAFDCNMIPAATLSILPCVDGQNAPRLYEVSDTDNEGSYGRYRYDRRHWIGQTDNRYYFDKLLGTSMNFTFGYMFEYESEINEEYGPLGQMYYWFNGPTGSPDFTTPYEVSLENGPAVAVDRQQHNGAYVSDQIKIKRRAVLTLGARWDYYHDYEPTEYVRNDATFRAFYYAGAPLPNGYSIPATNPTYTIPAQQILRFPFLFAPRIGLAVDLTGKGNTILKLSYGRFFNQPGVGIGNSYVNGLQFVGGSGAGSPTSGTAMTFKWSDPTDAPFNMNQLGAFVSGSLPATAFMAPGFKAPHLDEWTLFIDKQFTKTFSARAGFVFKRAYDDYYQKDVGRPYSLYTQWISVDDPGTSGIVGGPTDRGIIHVCCDIPTSVNPLPASQYEMTNLTTPQEYYGWDASLNKRMANHWMVSGGFAWNASRILYQGSTANAAPNNPLQAYNNGANLSYWSANARASYQAPLGLVISPTFRAIQGQPADRTLTMSGLHVGSYSLIVDPYQTYRYDNIYVLDARIEKRLKFKEKYNLGLFFDVYNITNGNGLITYQTTTGRKSVTLSAAQFPSIAGTYSYALFGSPASTASSGTGGVTPPFVCRIGIRANF